MSLTCPLWHKWLLFRICLTSDRIGCVKQEPVTCFRYVGSPLALENAQKNLMDMEDDE